MTPLRHLAFLRFHSTVTDKQVRDATTAMAALPSLIPGILHFKLYPLSSRATLTDSHGFTLMVDTIFPSLPVLTAFMTHPAHHTVLKDMQPLVADRLLFDYYPKPREGFTMHEYNRLQVPPYCRRVVLYRVKEQGQEEIVGRRFYELHDQQAIPSLLRTVVGKQAEAGEMSEGWVARSQGLDNIVEWVMTDGQGVQQFLEHPAYQRVVKANSAQLSDTLTFDYDMH